MYPAIHYGLVHARIAAVHDEAHRGALARAARRARREHARAIRMTEGETPAGSRP
jgi:hypothetical protein